MPAQTISLRPRTYWISGASSRASINNISVAPGMPKTYLTPSVRINSIRAVFPVILFIWTLPEKLPYEIPERGGEAAFHRVNEVDPLTSLKCSGAMKVISVLEDKRIVKKILKHLDLWDRKARPPPKATGSSKIPDYSIDYSTSQLPVSDKWLYVDQEYPEACPP